MRLFVIICSCALLATACSKVPSQQSYPYTYQQKMQSAAHWENLASKVVLEQVQPFFAKTGLNKPDSVLGVYLNDADRSAFGTAFHTYLTSRLFDNDIPVSDSPMDCFTIEWSVQKVFHNSDRYNPGPPVGIIGAAFYAVGTVFGADTYVFGRVPNTELLVTLEVKDGDMVYSRRTVTFYINDEDTANYWVMPDNESVASYTFVREGAVVCREPGDLETAFSQDTQGRLHLNDFIGENRCAIMSKNYPVSILDRKDNYFVIKSEEKPHYIYVTSKDSLGG